MRALIKLFWAILAISAGTTLLHADDATIPGAVTSPYPTLRNIAIEWQIEGDDNINGVVSVSYRDTGQLDWKQGMPLRRIPAATWAEQREDRTEASRSWGNKHSGSIFDLQPDTKYEIRVCLHDPDGGDAERTLRVQTRPVPEAMENAPVKYAHPGNFEEIAANAKPGDIILLGPGNYGYVALTRDGLPGKPIVFRADPDGRFEFQDTHSGDALFEGISLQGRKHVYLEGLVSDGTIDLFNAEACVIRRCRIYGTFGIVSSWTGNMGRKWAPSVSKRMKKPPVSDGMPVPFAKNCYNADNIITGMTQWSLDAIGPAGKNIGEGIEINGPGNVICHNRVTGFRDCISTLEGRYAIEQVCIDIYNNDIYTGPDDGIEADYTMGNCRIMRNRITNCGIGLSSQPGLGGPTYFIRNVMYNMYNMAYKFYRNSVGDIVLHNTVVKSGHGAICRARATWSQGYFRNNIGIGGKGIVEREGAPMAAFFPGADNTCDFDYNGYGMVGLPFQGNIRGITFDSQASMRANTGEKHGMRVGLDIFAAPIVIPNPPMLHWQPPDLRLRVDSDAVDAAIVIPNINDIYTGTAPDLGAYELGQEMPVYGPRP